MSITQTAETLAAYDRRITELSATIKSDTRAMNGHRASSLFFILLTVFLAVLTVLSLLLFIGNNKDGAGILIIIGLVLALCSYGAYTRACSERDAANALQSSIEAMTVQERELKASAHAITSGVIAVTSRDMNAYAKAGTSQETPVTANMATKTCPACAEEVKTAANICKHCRFDFTA